MKKLFTLLTLLIVAIGTSWAADYTAPATKTYGSITFLDVAGTDANRTDKNGKEYLTYGVYYVAKTKNITTWFNSSDGSPASNHETTGYSITDAVDYGFYPVSSTSGDVNYGGTKCHSNRWRYFYVTGASSVAGIARDGDSKSNKYTQLKIEEVAEDGTLGTATVVGDYGSTSAGYLIDGGTLDPSKYYKISFGSQTTSNCYFYQVRFGKAPAGPTITTQPQSASYVTGDEIAALTVEATPDDATFQWYSCDDADKTNAKEIEGATGDSYTPTGAGFYYVAVTAGTTIDSDVAQITVSEASAPTSATIGSTSSSAEIGANVTLSITAMDGTPTPTEFKWYSCSDAEKTDATVIEGETGNTYTFSKNTTGTYYFFANVKNSQGNVDSNVLSVTITKKSAGLAYASTAVERNIGAAKFTNALTNPNELTVTYSVVDGATATGVSVDAATGEVTVGNVAGTATIKASFAGNDEYLAGDATYTLTVVVPDPAIQSANVVIAKSATGGNIAFTVGYHSAHGGVVTATTTADWITLGDVTIDTYGAGTVAFTNDANPGFASRFANVTLTYTYNTNQTKTTTLVVAQEANIVGTSIIKVPVQDATHAGEITGSIGGTATVSLQTTAAAVDGGYKFGVNGNNITITLADSKTFQEGDIFIVHTTKAADTNPGILSMYSGDNMVLNTGTKGVLGVNAFVLPAAANDKTTIAVKRVNNSDYTWNGYVDYIEVVRPNATIELNDGGSSFTKGFSTFCASANYTLTGATAYAATISDSKLIMTAIEGVIPANEGVVIAGDKNAEVTINYTTEAATTVTDNDLKGTTVAAKTADLKGTATKFLAFKKTTSTFTPYGGENFPANKAYILLDGENAPLSLEMVFDEATGINNVNAAETEAQTAPVKVIKNGKLYIGNYNVAGQQVK